MTIISIKFAKVFVSKDINMYTWISIELKKNLKYSYAISESAYPNTIILSLKQNEKG
jgi:hypothetical protein